MLRMLCAGLVLVASGAHAQQHPLAAVQAEQVSYWTSAYVGDDLTSGKFACANPNIPAVSTTNEDIRKTEASIAVWEACYNGFVANFNDAQPPGKRIPEQVAKKMTSAEMSAARARMASVYDQVIAAAETDAQKITEQREAWRLATQNHVATANDANARKAQQRREDLLNDMRRTADDVRMQSGRSGGATK